MKRFIALVLVFAVLLPSFGFASTVEEWMVEGNWIGYWHEDNGARSMIFIELEEENRAYFVTQFFHADEPGLGRAYIGEWELNGNIVHVKIGNNTSMDLEFRGNGLMVDTLTGRMLFLGEWR